MEKQYGLENIRHRLRDASGSIPTDYSCHRRDYEFAVNFYTDVVREAEAFGKSHPEAVSYNEWQELLCTANFGLGLTTGLQEMKNSTYKGKHRPLCELESIVSNFEVGCSHIRAEPLVPHNHLNLGKAYGGLGLAKEGKNMLEIETYWDNINTYIKQGGKAK